MYPECVLGCMLCALCTGRKHNFVNGVCERCEYAQSDSGDELNVEALCPAKMGTLQCVFLVF